MSNLNQILSAYMDNIIRLLQSLVKSVKENNDLLQKNYQLLTETKELIQNMPQQNIWNLGEMSDSLDKFIKQLQKGLEGVQLNSIMEDIKSILRKLDTENLEEPQKSKGPAIYPSPVTEEFKSEIETVPEKKDDEDEHLIRPSSFVQ